VWLKAENLQRTGSFKIRGAFNRISRLTDTERAGGVVTASAGNHGQAVAWAAREAGVHATVFMPEDAPTAKIEATKSYGAEVVLAGGGFDEAAAAADERVGAGGTMVHAFEDPLVIAGQGTLGLELADQLGPEVKTVVVPIGGGGLVSGVALALREARPEIEVVGVQAAACAPFAGRAPTGATIADGIAVKHPGELTGALVGELVDTVLTVGDAEIAGAILLVSERCKLTVEGAGAAAVAALLSGDVPGDGPACAVLSGGNIDASSLIEILRHGLTRAGRYVVVRTRVTDRPGNLAQLLALVAEERGNVLGVDHHREGMDLPVMGTEIELTLATRDEGHCAELLARLDAEGYPVERLR
jgi:threonine dehydratase